MQLISEIMKNVTLYHLLQSSSFLISFLNMFNQIRLIHLKPHKTGKITYTKALTPFVMANWVHIILPSNWLISFDKNTIELIKSL